MAMNTLHIFDFDDTLVKSDAKVKIKTGSTTNFLSSEEYASYKEKPGDILDFSDFDAYPKNPEIIEPVFAELKAAIALDGPDSVVILTARSNPSPVRLFLEANNIAPIHIEAVGSSDPMRKADYILSRVMSSPEINEVRVFEDNVRNIRTIQKTVTSTGVKLKTSRVHNGKVQGS